MHHLLLTIFCSTSIAIILKINAGRKGDSIQLLTGNYFTASIIGLLLLSGGTNNSYNLELIPLGLFLSFLFVGSIFAFSKSVVLSGAAVSTLSSRLSVFVPTVLSIIVYNELPGTFQLFGLLLTAGTIIFFYYSIKSSNSTSLNKDRFIYLLSVLIGIGTADFFMKVFQENWTASDKPWFLFWIFFFSFIITLIISIRQRKSLNKFSLLLGMIMGIPNIFSSYFLIESLKDFSAVLVYPVVNISIIVATAIIVRIIWRESWNFFAKLSLIAGILAIIFLSL